MGSAVAPKMLLKRFVDAASFKGSSSATQPILLMDRGLWLPLKLLPLLFGCRKSGGGDMLSRPLPSAAKPRPRSTLYSSSQQARVAMAAMAFAFGRRWYCALSVWRHISTARCGALGSGTLLYRILCSREKGSSASWFRRYGASFVHIS